MNAKICDDAKGTNFLDSGITEIAVAKNVDDVAKIPSNDLNPPPVSVVPKNKPSINANNALGNLWRFCRNFEQSQRKNNLNDSKQYAALIRREKQNIVAAGNPKDFAEPFFNFLSNSGKTINEDFKLHCLIIGRKIGMYWNDSQKRRLTTFCLDQLIKELTLTGFELKGRSVNTKIQAIYTLHVCASADDLKQLKKLHQYEKFKRDYQSTLNDNPKTSFQITTHALGVAFRLGDGVRDGVPTKSSIKRKQIVSELCKIIRSKKLSFIEMQNCFLALGLICDCRYENDLDENSLDAARNLIDNIENIYDVNFVDRFRKAVVVADKILHGAMLSAAEEEFLLIKLDD